MAMKSFSEFVEDAESHDFFWIELATLELTEEVWRRMEALGVSKAELASRLGTSPAYVTRILRGNASFSLATMVKIARALESKMHIQLAPNPVTSAEANPLAPSSARPSGGTR